MNKPGQKLEAQDLSDLSAFLRTQGVCPQQIGKIVAGMAGSTRRQLAEHLKGQIWQAIP